MIQKAIKCYGIKVSQNEVKEYLTNSDCSLDQLTEKLNALCAFLDQAEQFHVFIYKKKDVAKSAVAQAKSIGFRSVEHCPTFIYVPEVYFNESSNGC